MDAAIELVQNVLQDTLKKSAAFCGVTVVMNKGGEASIHTHIPAHLGPGEKILASALLAAACGQIAAQNAVVLANFARQNVVGKINGSK